MILLERLGDAIWNPWLLGLFLLVGLYYSLRTGFFQLFGCPIWLKTTLGSLFHRPKAGKSRGITQTQALATALASTIGTGSIAGVASAIFYGGPGAVFWMWISAFLGMMTGCAEKILAVRYHRPSPEGGWEGGPIEYITNGLGTKPLALTFALCCTGAALIGGGMVQANSIATATEAAFGVPRIAAGVGVAVLTGTVILGGIGRIGKVSERLVPVMALMFLTGGILVIICHAEALPAVLGRIFTAAFTPKSAFGGTLGYGIGKAMRYGIARGVFTNEAGLGSSAIAHAAADVKEPAEEGMWGIFEVFVATLLVCTVTALVILTTGVYDEGAALLALETGTATDGMAGAPLSSAAFATVLGRLGGPFVSMCLFLFAFSSLIGWSYYGERGLTALTGSHRAVPLFRMTFLVFIVAGSVWKLNTVWQIADICNGLMALPNLLTLLLLSPEALSILNKWLQKQSRPPP